MGWIEDEVDVLVVEVEDEVDREGLGSSSPRFMPLRGPGYGRYKLFSRASHFPTILPGFTFPPVLLGEPYSYPSPAKASPESETTLLVGGSLVFISCEALI